MQYNLFNYFNIIPLHHVNLISLTLPFSSTETTLISIPEYGHYIDYINSNPGLDISEIYS